MSSKKRSVGLIILTRIPGIGTVAVLKARGSFNIEKMSPESYPGVCQVTVHGGLKDGESEMKALFREIREELGKEVEKELKEKRNCIIPIYQWEKKDKKGVTYMIELHPDFLKKIRLNGNSGEIRLVTRDVEKILDVNVIENKLEGVVDRRMIVMFEDEKAAVKKVFNLLYQPTGMRLSAHF